MRLDGLQAASVSENRESSAKRIGIKRVVLAMLVYQLTLSFSLLNHELLLLEKAQKVRCLVEIVPRSGLWRFGQNLRDAYPDLNLSQPRVFSQY